MPAQPEVEIRTNIGNFESCQIGGQSEFRTLDGDISVADGRGEFELKDVTGGIKFEGEYTDQSDDHSLTWPESSNLI